MNELQVFIVSELGESYVGRVGEVLGVEDGYYEGGPGESVAAVISDIVGALASEVLAGNSATIHIELRE